MKFSLLKSLVFVVFLIAFSPLSWAEDIRCLNDLSKEEIITELNAKLSQYLEQQTGIIEDYEAARGDVPRATEIVPWPIREVGYYLGYDVSFEIGAEREMSELDRVAIERNNRLVSEATTFIRQLEIALRNCEQE